MGAAAAVLRKIMAVARPEALLSRAEVLTRYRHLRARTRTSLRKLICAASATPLSGAFAPSSN